MAHFARLINNTVFTVIVVDNSQLNDLPFPESEPIGIDFCKSLYGQDTNWKQTSYNANFRKHYAGIGYTYDDILDAFIPFKPYSSWILNTQTCEWEAPVPYPDNGKIYGWDETTQTWVEIQPNDF